MKVLWQVNIVMPEAAKAIGLTQTNFGGWLVGAAQLLKKQDVDLTIVTVSILTKRKTHVNVDGIEYYVLPSRCDYQTEIWDIIQTVQPDLIHIHGTEYDFNTQLIHICSKHNIKSVVSLQGLMCACAEHYMDGIPSKYNQVNPFLRLMSKIYYADSIAMEQRRFAEQGKIEIEALKKVQNVIGRTTWDKEMALSINPNLTYFHVNESLRPEFYTGERWDYNKCEKHSIFISQASYPIKGLHMLLGILPKLIEEYPDLQVYIGGSAPYTFHYKYKFMDFILDGIFEYQGYIKKLIRMNRLKNHIHYTGPLNPQGMKTQYLKCNVFVSLSSIENESNSISEAKMLGVPVVASRVGGVCDRITNGVNGLSYEFFDTETLRHNIRCIFNDQNQLMHYCNNAHMDAVQINDREKNTQALLAVYREIAG